MYTKDKIVKKNRYKKVKKMIADKDVQIKAKHNKPVMLSEKDTTIPVKEVVELLNERDLLKIEYNVLRQNFRVALDLLLTSSKHSEVIEFVRKMKELYGEEFVQNVQGCRSD